jgi:hypothetical protein
MFAPPFWPTQPALRLGAPRRRDEPSLQVMRDSDPALLRDQELLREIVKRGFSMRHLRSLRPSPDAD